MSKILMLYASVTGNTEEIAVAIAEMLQKYNHEITMKTFDVDAIDVEELTEYDAILVGTYSWDDGAMPYEVEDFYEELEDAELTDKLVGVFGSGDTFYETFGGAIELLGNRFEELGANVMPDWIKIDLEPDEKDFARCQKFADDLTTKLLKIVEAE
ncbi:flavodoxin [Virgibacillus phasianinus]|uniref:Flavodoxin n=1 Tax=Virgibacillus phasianinus TaxID=2017483 RepID=A0A220U302_9BACI|nr:flavodoxin [Virgibacillus phasianinus]ASK62664.1 flavodoxin [Virgibacillus phasianinus]